MPVGEFTHFLLNSWTRGRLIKTQELAEKGPLWVNSSQLSETTNMRSYPHSNSDSLPLRAVTQTATLNTDIFMAHRPVRLTTIKHAMVGPQAYHTDITQTTIPHTDSIPLRAVIKTTIPPTSTQIVCHYGLSHRRLYPQRLTLHFFWHLCLLTGYVGMPKQLDKSNTNGSMWIKSPKIPKNITVQRGSVDTLNERMTRHK